MAMNWRTFSILVLGAMMSAASDAQEVEQIVPPSQGSVGTIDSAAGGHVAPIGATSDAGKPVAPIGGTTADAPLFSGDSIAAAMTDTLLQRLKTHTLTPAAAWESGALDVDVLLDILGHRLGPWGGFYWERDDDLRRALVKLLIEHGGGRLEDKNKLALPVRLWIADYYWNLGDERVLPWAESAIADLKPGAVGQEDLALQAVERIGWFYRDKGESLKAAQAWERLQPLLKTEGWQVPDSWLEAARMYAAAGDETKAQALYASVLQKGDGWLKGAALYDQARALMKQGKHNEARTLLKQPITGERAENVQVALLTTLGLSYYQTGNFNEAAQYSQKALKQAESSKLPENLGLEAQINVSEAIVRWSAQWLKEPMVLGSEKIDFVAPSKKILGKAMTQRVSVLTFKDAPIIARIDNEKIKVRVLGEKQNSGYFIQQQIELEVAPENLTKSVDAILTLHSPNFPEYQTQVPIHIKVPKPIQLSSSTVFFGQVKAGVQTTQTLTLIANVPFRVLEVKSDNSALEAASKTSKAEREQQIELKITTPKAGQFYSGTFRITTDMNEQEVIEVSYAARAE